MEANRSFNATVTQLFHERADHRRSVVERCAHMIEDVTIAHRPENFTPPPVLDHELLEICDPAGSEPCRYLVNHPRAGGMICGRDVPYIMAEVDSPDAFGRLDIWTPAHCQF